jgi:hypothetical protein
MRLRLIRNALLTTALLSIGAGACMMDDELEQEGDAVGESQAELTGTLTRPGYYLDSAGHYKRFNVPRTQGMTTELCNHWKPNAVARAWHLKEVNKYDFRWSKQGCREILGDGTLASNDSTVRTHFFNEGSGDYGASKVPLDRLPVGVRLRYKNTIPEKVADVAMLYMPAAEILDGETEPDNDYTYAMGRSANNTETLQCDPGYVVAGIDTRVADGGINRDEITGVIIYCRLLAFGRR